MALTSGAKSQLDRVASDRDMKLIGVLSRLVEWFVAQDKTMQSVILGLIDQKDAPLVAGLIYKRLCADLTDKHLDIEETLSEAFGDVRKQKKKGQAP